MSKHHTRSKCRPLSEGLPNNHNKRKSKGLPNNHNKRNKTPKPIKEGFQPLDERGYLQISVPGLRYESRDIIKIYLGAGGCEYTQAFYRSSGSNTKQTGTFMPFDGIGLKRKSGSFVHESFLEKSHVQSLRGFTDLSDEGSGDQLSPKKFFSRLGNCHLGLISFLLGGPAWKNPDTYELIYLEKMQNQTRKRRCRCQLFN